MLIEGANIIMNVIKPGDQERARRKVNQTKKFECLDCGCVFECDYGEWKYDEEDRPGVCSVSAKCPTCHQTTYHDITNKTSPYWDH